MQDRVSTPSGGKMRILVVVGPTASGKTTLAIELARSFGGEIISCDSMQVYRGLDIGTAKPTKSEMMGIPHHMIDIAEPEDDFSVAEYVRLAAGVTKGIISRGRLPIFCGGTGLYLDSFLRGGDFAVTEGDPQRREELGKVAKESGREALHEHLQGIDPESAAAIHPNNVRRVIRAIEIFELTGIKKSEHDRISRTQGCEYTPVIIGLYFSERAELYRRIDIRVEQMLKSGLLEETERLLKAGVFERSRTAAQAIGYKELLSYIWGEATLPAAADELKRSTKRYAKRQLTWFLRNPYIHWIDVMGKGADEIVHEATCIMDRVQSDEN